MNMRHVLLFALASTAALACSREEEAKYPEPMAAPPPPTEAELQARRAAAEDRSSVELRVNDADRRVGEAEAGMIDMNEHDILAQMRASVHDAWTRFRDAGDRDLESARKNLDKKLADLDAELSRAAQLDAKARHDAAMAADQARQDFRTKMAAELDALDRKIAETKPRAWGAAAASMKDVEKARKHVDDAWNAFTTAAPADYDAAKARLEQAVADAEKKLEAVRVQRMPKK